MTGMSQGWSAIVPLKPTGQRKTRLAGLLSVEQRDRLAIAMFHHVAATLRAVPAIADIAILSPSAPPGWTAGWIRDQGRGLNAELYDAAAARGQNLLIIHADLPLLTAADIFELISCSPTRSAIAPDRHGTGTNALALRDQPDFDFAFGDNSLPRHLAQARRPLRMVERLGLGLDVDTWDDLVLAASYSNITTLRATVLAENT